MNNALIPANVKIPTHLAARIGKPSALAHAVAGGLGTGESGPRISIKGARFRIIEGDTENVLESLTLDAIIVGANPGISKIWYATEWAPDNEPQAPDCFSLDGVKPDPSVVNPQNPICATCPHNAWGSRITKMGQKVKACADQKRLALVAADDPEGPIYLLQVTPAALKGLNQYQKDLSIRGIPPEIVKTKIGFDTDASFPKLTFGFGGFLDEDTQGIVDGLFGTDAVRAVTGERTPEEMAKLNEEAAALAQQATHTPVAAKTQQAAVRKPEPEPESEPEYEPDPGSKPAKRGFGAKAAAVPAAEAEPEAKRGFGAKAAAAKPAAKPAAARAARVAPKASAAAAEDATSLADEIAALVGDDDVDDA